MQYTPVEVKVIATPSVPSINIFMKCLYGIVNNLFIKYVLRWTFHTIELAVVNWCEALNVVVAPYPAPLAHH